MEKYVYMMIKWNIHDCTQYGGHQSIVIAPEHLLRAHVNRSWQPSSSIPVNIADAAVCF